MRIRLGSAAYAALALAFVSCSENGPLSPATPAPQLATVAMPTVRISEFHYDNASTDVDEKVEISGPAGMSLSGWSLVLYNGTPTGSTSRTPYTTTKLDTLTIPATCGGRGVVVISYPANGIQNGGTSATATTDPDGMVLVNGTAVVDSLAWEGSFVGATGVATGVTFPDIGVRELGTESITPKVTSLKRDANGAWTGPTANDFGTCNDNGVTPPPVVVAHVVVTPDQATVLVGGTQQFTASATDAGSAPVTGVVYTWSSLSPTVASVDANGLATGLTVGDAVIVATAPNGVAGTSALHVNPVASTLPETRFSEIHYDNTGADVNEKIEIEGPAGQDLTGWSVVLYTGSADTAYSVSVLPATRIPSTCGSRGVVVVDYPSNGIQNGGPDNAPEADGFALVDQAGHTIEFLSYEGVFTAKRGPADGITSTDIGVRELSSQAIGLSLHRDSDGKWLAPSGQGFGYCGTTSAPPPNGISFSGRLTTDPALPVGFEDQLFATERLGTGGTATTTFTWASESPALASIDANGVMHALGAGMATFRATAADGTTATYSLVMEVATASTTAQYGNNTEFGVPTDWDESDDYIIRRDQFTTSFNKSRNTPNWVSYDLDGSQIGNAIDRCDCFTYDPELPSDYRHITTADYTGAGAFAGYGIDRGHMARSFDRTTGTLDNAYTYLFSNVIPQAADLNQGPWAQMENYLGHLATDENKEVYIITGPAGNIGTLKNEGKVIIPEKVWKVAVIMPRDQGLADVHDYSDVEVIAVIAPNKAGVRDSLWTSWKTTVDAVEALSGYDLLSLLPDRIERAVESNTKPPHAVTDGGYAPYEGSAVPMSGAGSYAANGSIASYTWNFGDGIENTGVSVSHTYTQDGTYTVRLIVADNDGLVDTTTTTAQVFNVAPAIDAFDGATLLPGETYGASGTFTDPGADPWTGTVNYGDGTTSSLALSGKSFSLSHSYTTPGTYTVTVRVSDDDVTSARTQTVTVLTATQAVNSAAAIVSHLVKDGTITAGSANSLMAKLDAAQKQIDNGNMTPVSGQLGALLNELNAMVRSGRLSAAEAEPLRTMVQRVLQSIA